MMQQAMTTDDTSGETIEEGCFHRLLSTPGQIQVHTEEVTDSIPVSPTHVSAAHDSSAQGSSPSSDAG
jgi:hypothetical protein